MTRASSRSGAWQHDSPAQSARLLAISLINDLLEKNGGGFALEEMQKAIDLRSARQEFAGDDADNRAFFDASMASLIRTLHAELRAR